MVSFISLIVSAALPVVNVFLMCLVGFALARKVCLDLSQWTGLALALNVQ